MNQHKRMLGVKYFSVVKSLEFPRSGKILTLPRSPSLQHCSESTASPLMPRGSPRWGCCCELLLEQEIQTREGSSLLQLIHEASPTRLQCVPLMPAPFSTNLCPLQQSHFKACNTRAIWEWLLSAGTPFCLILS